VAEAAEGLLARADGDEYAEQDGEGEVEAGSGAAAARRGRALLARRMTQAGLHTGSHVCLVPSSVLAGGLGADVAAERGVMLGLALDGCAWW